MDKNVHNMKINRITFLVFGILFILIGVFVPFLLIIGAILLFLAYKTNKTYKAAISEANKPKEVDKPAEPVIVKSDKVKITDIDGSVHEVSEGIVLDDPNRVLIAKGGKTYHTHVACFKNWKPEMIASFEGWQIISKSEAIKKGMRYCKFCEEADDYTLDDIDDFDDIDEDEEM